MRLASLIALFHAVGTPEATGYRDALGRAALERRLQWLKRHYSVIPLEELMAEAAAGRPLRGLAALSFDDNHRSVLAEALPLAANLALPATWFLIAGPLVGQPFWRSRLTRLIAAGRAEAFVAFARERVPAAAALRPERLYRDSKDPARIDSPTVIALLEAFLGPEAPEPELVQCTELAGGLPAGVSLANHSLTHPVLAGLDASQQYEEIAAAEAVLADLPCPRRPLFAVPFGGPDSYDAATWPAAEAAGVAGLLLTHDELRAADDLSLHPLARSGQALGRVLLGRLPDDVFD